MANLPDLKPDCSACAALCCVVFAFDKSESFAIDKAAGEVCPNLNNHNQCCVFEKRETLGFNGCIAYDCYGAGQVVTSQVFGGRSWRHDPSLNVRMGAALSVLRRIHEQLMLLETAQRFPLDNQELAKLSELKSMLVPEQDWTENNLADYPVEEAIEQVSDFLKNLRRHVGR